MVRWLHISDLHIKNRADWNNFRKELLKKCKDIGKFDLVIVTGDFHDFSKGNNFEEAKNFLRGLMDSLQLDIVKDLFLIPGNHDGVTQIDRKDLYIRAIQYTPLDIKEEDMKTVLGMFGDYERFVKELIPGYPTEHPAAVHSRSWRNQINFIHCNTAIAADGSSKKNQILDTDGLALVEYSEDCPNILLAHNNFNDLHEDIQRRVKDTIRNNWVCAYLCGDRHIESVEQISYEDKQNCQIPCIGCYKSAPDPMDNYSNFGIIIGEWEMNRVMLKGWYWRSGEGFRPDNHITEQRIDMHKVEQNEENQKTTRTLYGSSKENIGESEKKEMENPNYRGFISRFYKLTPAQLRQFNYKYDKDYRKLECKLPSLEVFHFIKEADEKHVLEEMIEYMDSL